VINKKRIFASLASFALVFSLIPFQAAQAAPVAGLTSSQNQTIDALFKALATSDPDKIAVAKRKYLVSGSPAYQYVDMIQNHYSTVRYFKSINSFGIPSGVKPANEPKGTYSKTSRGVKFNSSADAFDGFHSKFAFNSKGKIRNWTVGTMSNSNPINLSNRIWPVTSSITQNGFLVDGGYIYKEPSKKTTVQLRVTNKATNLKSWSFAGGNYGDPSNKYFDLGQTISGCLYMGQTAFFETQLSTWPTIATGTEAVVNPPVFNGCGAGSSSTSAVFRFQTG
jgi:hypothetical protein